MKSRIEKERSFWDSFAKKYDRNNQKNAKKAYQEYKKRTGRYF